MKSETDLRIDVITARHIAQALKIQAEYGYEKARCQLEALGAHLPLALPLALALLARRYDRRDPARPATGSDARSTNACETVTSDLHPAAAAGDNGGSPLSPSLSNPCKSSSMN